MGNRIYCPKVIIISGYVTYDKFLFIIHLTYNIQHTKPYHNLDIILHYYCLPLFCYFPAVLFIFNGIVYILLLLFLLFDGSCKRCVML